MKHIFVLNGKPESGKDAFANICASLLRKRGITCYTYSSVNKVKQAAMDLGWNGIKSPQNRKALSELKDLSSKYWDGPYKDMCNFLDFVMEENNVAFLMIREPDEIERIVKTYSETRTILIQRESTVEATNHADENVHLYGYDYLVENNGSLEELKESAISLLKDCNILGENV